MKILILSFVAFAFSIGLYAQDASNLTLISIDNEQVVLEEILEDHDYVMVAFWATWCKPCLDELEAYNDGYEELMEEFNLEILAVSVDDTRSNSKVKPLVASQAWDFPVFTDANKELMRSFHFSFVPSIAIMNKEGEIIYRHVQYTPGDEDEVFEFLAGQ